MGIYSRNNVNFLFSSFLLSLVFSIFLTNVYAEEQLPGMVIAVEGDPYYFSENGFGPKILKYFERPLEPYLVPGVTTEQSSFPEIKDAYLEATKERSQSIIVDDDSRAQTIRVSFFGAEITETQTFDSFLKFEHLEVQRTYYPLVPYYYDISQEGFALESLPSKDKKWFYDFIVSRTINSDKDPEPFDVDIEILAGSGTVLQIWEYRECQLAEYFPLLDENLVKLKFNGDFISEIREISAFECGGFHVDFEPKPVKSDSILPSDVIPLPENRAQKILVQFSGGELVSEVSYFTFSKFVPIKDVVIPPIKLPGFPVDEKPQFILESLPSKDKQEFYEFVARYIDPVKTPEPFDAKIHLVTDDNSILQTWSYDECTGTNYVTYFLNNLLFYKFKQTMGSEIRDKIFFECNGIQIGTETTIDSNLLEQIGIPDNFNRAQIFKAHFEGPDISPTKTVTTFTKFSPVTNDELQLLLPGAPFGGKPKFYFESLASEDKEWLYLLIESYVNPGKTPEPFDVTTEVLTGDGTILQVWDYENCQVIDYRTFLEDILVYRKFTKQFDSEIHDRFIFQCEGFSMNPSIISSQIKPEKSIDYADFAPTDDNRAQRFLLTLSGGELSDSLAFYSFSKFEPKMDERSSQTPSTHKLNSIGFALENLPTKDKESYYSILQDFINPGKSPEPFDATIDVVTGGGDVLQSWEYKDCSLIDFDYFLQDNLLYFTMNGKKATSEIRDRSEFECIGFSADFEIKEKQYLDIPDIVPRYEDRAAMYLFHASGGELQKTHSTGMISKFTSKDTVSDEIEQIVSSGALRNVVTSSFDSSIKTENFGYPKFMGESLPNKIAQENYQVIERYINPGKDPERFDIRVDVVSGDGTILYAGDYDECSGFKYSTYLNDGIAWIKFHPSLKFEFRDRFEIECIGVDALVMPQKNPRFSFGNQIVKPLVQLDVGVPPEEVVCKDGMSLMIRPPTNNAVCVFDDHVEQMEQRGWIVSDKQPSQISTKLRPVIPTDEERAQKILVHLQSPDFDPTTIETFSKFSPIEKQNFPLLIPEHDFTGNAALFYLESLPSKDKDWLYQVLSNYVNPGKTPEPMDVTVEIFSGDETLLQTWDYKDCERESYEVYLDESMLVYKLHEKWQSEIKDRIIFSCQGLSFE